MRSVAHALAYVALIAFTGCGKDIADAPTFTGSMEEGGSAAVTGSGGNATTDGGADDDETPMDQGQESGPDPDDGPMETMGPAESSSGGGVATTGGQAGEESGDGNMGGCNDGMVSPGEQCDGADLQGFDCASLGLAGGTLSCDPVTCTFDTSMCMSGGDGGTGGL